MTQATSESDGSAVEYRYVCPECEAPTLPPAVMPSGNRLCAKCGARFLPTDAFRVITLALRRVYPGAYETLDGKRRLIRTERDGPRGGTPILWESAYFAAYPRSGGCWILDNDVIERTLRDARARLAVKYAKGEL